MIRLKSAKSRPSTRPTSKGGARSLLHSLSSSPGRSIKAPFGRGYEADNAGKWIAVELPTHPRPWTAEKPPQRGLDWKGFWSSPKAGAKLRKTTIRPGKSVEKSFDEVIIGTAPKLPYRTTDSTSLMRTHHSLRPSHTKQAIKAWVEPSMTLDSLLATPVHASSKAECKVTVGALLRLSLKTCSKPYLPDYRSFKPSTKHTTSVIRRTVI